MLKKPLFLIGAGASASIGDGIPVMKTVFKEAGRFLNDDAIFLALTALEWHRVFTKRDSDLENFAAGYRLIGKDDPELASKLRQVYGDAYLRSKERGDDHFEEVFSRAAEILFQGGESESYVRLLYFLNRLFVKLSEIYPLNGPNQMDDLVGLMKQCLHNEPLDSLTIVSFNYDLWLDVALYRAGIWRPPFGYGVAFEGYLDSTQVAKDAAQYEELTGGGKAMGISPTTVKKPSSVIKHPTCLLLKPNGSLSWLHDAGSLDRRPVLLTSQDAYDSSPSYNPDFRVNFPSLEPPHLVTSGLEPLVVPPTSFKRRNHRAIWETDVHLKQRLATTDVVVIVGWSLPKTDYDYETILRRAIEGRENQVEYLAVCDLNQKDEFFARFEQIIRPRRTVFAWNEGFGQAFAQALLGKLRRHELLQD